MRHQALSYDIQPWDQARICGVESLFQAYRRESSRIPRQSGAFRCFLASACIARNGAPWASPVSDGNLGRSRM